MQKAWLLLIALTLTLTACNLPVGNTPAPSDADEIATRVAETLTLAAGGASTPLPPGEQTPEGATATPALPPAEPTLTETPQPTLTPTPTATVNNSDPRQSLGAPAWQDTLDDGDAWGLDSTGYQDDYLGIKIENSSMFLTSYQALGWHSWRLNGQRPQNFYLEATLRPQNCSGSDAYGLVFRAPDYDSGRGYYLRLRCNGQFVLSAWPDDGMDNLSEWQTHSAFVGGANQTNRIGVLVNGSSLAVYANGTLVQTVTDSSFSDAGHIGVFISAVSTPGFTVEMSEISYWNLP